MKTIIGIALAALLLTSCDASTNDVTGSFSMPQELHQMGCKMYRMTRDGKPGSYYVMVCPHSTTSTTFTSGKTTTSVSVVSE